MALPDSNFYIRFSEHTAYCCVRVGGKLNIEEGQQKGGKCYIESSFMNCTAYRIVLVGGIKGNEMVGPCSTHSGYRNKDVM